METYREIFGAIAGISINRRRIFLWIEVFVLIRGMIAGFSSDSEDASGSLKIWVLLTMIQVDV